MHSALPQILLGILILLSTAIVVVPLLKRAGLGAVLGYVFAGALLGPFGVGFVHEPKTFLEVSEFGVVLLLFVIGLELQPARLWLMRRTILGFGGVQVLTCAVILTATTAALGLSVPAAVTVGLALSLSSTAFALQMLAERRELTSAHGRVALGMLLFQDLAAIPIIALVPLLGDSDATFGWQAIAYALGAVTAVIVIGRYLLRYALRLVAAAGTQELFTASALATVVGTALIMHAAGLSMALGGFLAGVLLADSQYRHALEADIEPFKGLLLGVFFIAVGMSVDLPLILAQWPTILGIAGGLIAVKMAVTYLTARAWGMPRGSALRLGVVISEGGEFAFVILAAAVAGEVLPAALADVLVAAVIVSMMLFAVLYALLARRPQTQPEAAFDAPVPENYPVIIAGFGRYGQIVARLLRAMRIGFTALEINPSQVDFVRRYGNRIHYGDAARLDLLRAAGTAEAKIFVLAIDEVETSLRVAQLVREHFPHVAIYARARNRRHAYRLMDLGVAHVQRELFLSSLETGRQVLQGLGVSSEVATARSRAFKRHDEGRLHAHRDARDDEQRLIDLVRGDAVELEALFDEDAHNAELQRRPAAGSRHRHKRKADRA